MIIAASVAQCIMFECDICDGNVCLHAAYSPEAVRIEGLLKLQDSRNIV